MFGYFRPMQIKIIDFDIVFNSDFGSNGFNQLNSRVNSIDIPYDMITNKFKLQFLLRVHCTICTFTLIPKGQYTLSIYFSLYLASNPEK